jgi:hypothetical protein
MLRLAHRLRGGIKFGIEVRHGLHDFESGDQYALVAIYELRDLRGLQVGARLATFRPSNFHSVCSTGDV